MINRRSAGPRRARIDATWEVAMSRAVRSFGSLLLVVIVVVAGAGCAATTAPAPITAPAAAASASVPEPCQMAIAALDAVIKRWDEQPMVLDRACVERVAGAGGKIHADAHFTIADQLQVLAGAPACTDAGGRYVVRLDPRSSAPSASPAVVLLTLWSDVPAAWDFNAVVDVATWPTRRPGASGLPVCGAAFGILRRPAGRWVATAVPPPRSRAQLELGR
jgi:hypothetical protein